MASRAMRFAIKPHGVLGTALSKNGSITKLASEPAPGLPVVDPAGLHHIHGMGPKGAGGAAGQIYSWLGIGEHGEFPEPVRQVTCARCVSPQIACCTRAAYTTHARIRCASLLSPY